MTLDRPDIKPLWLNCKDSLRHAGEHFAELNRTSTQKDSQEKNHHSKWVVLSVAHAADYYLRIFLKELDPNWSKFNNPNYGPNPSETIKRLKNKHWDSLQDSRKIIIGIIEEVFGVRNAIMHRIMPEDLTESVSVAAWALLGLLQSIKKEYNINSDTIVDRSPPIETDLYDLIRLPELQPYMNYVEKLLAESYGPEDLDHCPLCGTLSVLSSSCEICFQGISTIECDKCEEEYNVPDDSFLTHNLGLDVCPNCSK